MKRLAVALAAVLAVVVGLVIALPDRPDASTPSGPCAGDAALDFKCHARRLVALTERSGARAALQELARGLGASEYLRGVCHPLVHHVGRTAGADAGMRAFADGDTLCDSGYYHGVTEAVMAEMGPRTAVHEARTVCADLQGQRGPAGETTCRHGLGHGFMHVLDRDLRASLRGCDTLRPAEARQECYGGVFMENHTSADDPEHQSLRPLEPLYPCTALPRLYKPACYERQTGYALHVGNGDFAAVFRLCATTEHDFRSACRRALGGEAAAETRTIAAVPEQAGARRELCRLAGDHRARTDCIAGVVDVVLHDPVSEPLAEVDAFCAAWDSGATRREHAACLRAATAGYRRVAQRAGA